MTASPCAACRAVRNPFPDAQQTLFQFSSPADIALWNVFSDSEYGGKSTAALQLSEAEPVCPRGGFTCQTAAPSCPCGAMQPSGIAFEGGIPMLMRRVS